VKPCCWSAGTPDDILVSRLRSGFDSPCLAFKLQALDLLVAQVPWAITSSRKLGNACSKFLITLHASLSGLDADNR